MTPFYIALTVVAILLLVAFVSWFVWFSNNKLMVTNYRVNSDRAPESGMRIVHLSDLHAKRFGKGNRRLVKMVAAQSPDIICITGDIIHKYRDRDLSVAVETAEKLCKVATVLYVSGNHEMRNKRYRELKGRLEKVGVVIMDDTAAQYLGATFVGLNCAKLKGNKIFEVTPQNDDYKILLAHEPQFVYTYARADVDLVLCGHAHGGQWRLPFTDVGFYSPGQGLFPKLTSGLKTFGGTSMIISRGLGNSECPLRLFNRPEVVVVEIRR